MNRYFFTRASHFVIVALVAALLASACDDGYNSDSSKQVGGGGGPVSSGDTTPAEQLPADLKVVVSGGGRSEPETFNVECGSGQPDSQACDLIAKGGTDLFEPVAPDIACTEMYGGNDTAHVTGTVDGQQIETTFSRVNGCEIARWDDVVKLWWPEKVAPSSSDVD
jgi:hypothetical protein